MKLPVIGAGLCLLMLGACADNSPGGRAAHDRHEKFEEIGAAFKDITDELKETRPDIATIRTAAATIATHAPDLKNWFPVGSEPRNVKTDARETVWTDRAGFHQAMDRFVAASAAMRTAAESGDRSAIAAAVKPLGESCKGCHDRFREEE